MYYYYDILLNFGDDNNLFEFYEWEESDDVEFVKKIPLFRVPTNILTDCLKYKVKFDNTLLEQIKDKTILKSSNHLENAFLISDAKNALALELNSEGIVVSRSKLLLADEENLLEIMFTMKETNLKYKKQEKYSPKEQLRQMEKIKKLIKCEIDTLYESKNYSKLKYLYYEWFNKNNENIDTVYKEMTTSLQKDYNENLKRVYDFIKLSYHNIH